MCSHAGDEDMSQLPGLPATGSTLDTPLESKEKIAGVRFRLERHLPKAEVSYLR